MRKEAWTALDRVFLAVFQLLQRARHNVVKTGNSAFDAAKQRVEARLTAWWAAYAASTEALRGHGTPEDDKAARLLRIYGIVAAMMIQVCQPITGSEGNSPCDSPNESDSEHGGCNGDGINEDSFDGETAAFARLLGELELLRSSPGPRATPSQSDSSLSSVSSVSSVSSAASMSRSIVDLGWICPLFYVATKCRVHAIRHRAVELLALTTHREGIWDSQIMAAVAKQIVAMEEEAGRASPRIWGVSLVLAGEPVDTVHIWGRRGRQDPVACLARYDVKIRRWTWTVDLSQ